VNEYIYVERGHRKLSFNVQSRNVETHAFMTQEGLDKVLVKGIKLMLDSMIRNHDSLKEVTR